MFRLSGKVVLAVLAAGLICIGGFKGYAQTAMEKKIMVAFQDAMNAVLYPNELSMVGLSDQEIKKYVVKNAAKIIAETIKLVYKRTRKDIGVEEVLGALPPRLEEALSANKEQLVSQVSEILRENK